MLDSSLTCGSSSKRLVVKNFDNKLIEEDVVVRSEASHVYGPLVIGVALVNAGITLKQTFRLDF